ncbi:dual specificity protein phosphatase 16-like [Panonychus citri]|uniref:dual specificity protein phosphatase 16-like n=1 Tax=Panonychus citri TaxID=50023 RepID=UPI002308365F|nr:dual specificity protein phosphatase 16-like [Panonychus citri]
MDTSQVTTTSPCNLNLIDVNTLASYIKNGRQNILILDMRSFLEYNTSHVSTSFQVTSSKLVLRRLQQGKLTANELITNVIGYQPDPSVDIILYDQDSKSFISIPEDSFLAVFISKLVTTFKSVSLLVGGFITFQSKYPDLLEAKKYLTSLSQPCLPTTNPGPTKILPFLYLGSQHDAYNKELLKTHNITYELNVSITCPKPDFVQESHFMRIPVNDNYSEKLLPYFPMAFNFLEKVRESRGCVLVHCLAGISRSATIAIAYVMQHSRMTSDDAYRYVKSKRPTISPNFNFLGQLVEFEKQLRRDSLLEPVSTEPSFLSFSRPKHQTSGSSKRLCSLSPLTFSTTPGDRASFSLSCIPALASPTLPSPTTPNPSTATATK